MVFTDRDNDSTDDDYDLDGPASVLEGPSRRAGPPPPKRRRVSISSGSGGFSEEEGSSAFLKWKNKSKEARSKAAKSGRQARAIEAKNNPPPPSKSSTKTGVGKRAVRKKPTKQRVYGDSTSEDDALMEWTMPDYLQERRRRFDERRAQLKQGGLSLPPEYNDIEFSDDERLATLKEKPQIPLRDDAAPYEDIELPHSLGVLPASIAQHLRPYQKDGAAFLHELFVYQKGGILGDDMGLGKTIQVIAFLTAAYGKTGDERDQKRLRKMKNAGKPYYRTLIICPGSLMANWEDELRRWGWWHSSIYHGSTLQKEEILRTVEAGRLEIMITTYDTYRIAASKINMIRWDCVIADECHKIKERKAETTKILNEVNALCRIGLTGTAIQNKYEELWTLLNWANPGRLGPVSTWKASVCVPLKMGQSHNASQQELSKARQVAKLLVDNLLPQFFLRRTKSLIQHELPKKSDRVVFCPLTETQADAYQNFLESDIVTYIKDSTLDCNCGSKKKQGWCCRVLLEDGSPWTAWVFPAIMTLQKISNHLAILIPQASDPADKRQKAEDILQITMPMQWKKLCRERDNLLHSANPEFCGKWRVLKKLLKFWHEEGTNKVLVFSHSVRILKMLQSLFISTSYNVKYLDGSMDYQSRFETVQDFNTDPTQFVFLISTKAGGVGLNITSANKVVVVDPTWNPAYDLQAQDRAFRIGQVRDVEVFRLVSQGTIEEIVYARQIYKQQQANIGYNASTERRYFQGVQDVKEQKGEIFGLSNLFAWHNENVVLRDIISKTNVAESKAGLHIAELEAQSLEAKSEADSDDDHDTKNAASSSMKAESDHEDAAISQLAAEITGCKQRGKAGGKNGDVPKYDPIQAILSSVGVNYMHENSEVIGSSTIEDKLSKAALDAAANDASHISSQQQRKVFQTDTQTQTSPSSARLYHADGSIRYRYKPPTDVKVRQFGAMATFAGYDADVVDFALRVESWTQREQRDFLDKFYRYRRECLEGVHTVKDEAETETEDEGDGEL